MSAVPRRATTFLMAALAWSLGLFAILRSAWAQSLLVVPFAGLQKQAADYYAGVPAVAVAVTSECSGTDAIALCLAVIFACPVSWRARLAGAAGGLALIVALNTARIATLGHAAASPVLFRTLHLQVWPAVLVLATAGYAFAWMRGALGAADATSVAADLPRGEARMPALARRFAALAAVLLVAFAVAGPWIARSEALLAGGGWTARAGAFVLTTAGLAAVASGNVLATSRGAFQVTAECLATPLVPIYVAGVLAAVSSWPWRAVALIAGAPLFAGLAVARLLLLALPPALAASPLFLVHGFHQMVLAVVLVLLFAWWRQPPSPRRWTRAAGRAGAAVVAAAILAVVAGATFTHAVLGGARVLSTLAPRTMAELAAPGDTQGALVVLPAYQAALFLALGVAAYAGWRGMLGAFGVLVVSQVVFLVVLGAAAEGGLTAHAVLVRGWAVAVPVALTLAMLRVSSPARGARAPAGAVADATV